MTEELKLLLEREGYFDLKEVPGRGICGLRKFMFTWGLLWGLDESGYRGRWCYDNLAEPITALRIWDGIGDPKYKWIKYKGEGGERSGPERG